MNAPFPAPLRQSFAWWPFETYGPQLLDEAVRIGFGGVDFLPKEHWTRARDVGLELVAIDGHWPIEMGFNDPAHRATLSSQVRQAIEDAERVGARFVTVASGDRVPGNTDGMAACIEGLAPLAAEAVMAGVTLVIEPLNLVDHAGHECATTEWAAEIVRRVDSAGLRVLFDAYHAAMMREDVTSAFERNFGRIAHVHVAGFPGRHEIGQDQEMNWGALVRTMALSDYAGYVTHEFLPSGDFVAGLSRSYRFLEALVVDSSRIE